MVKKLLYMKLDSYIYKEGDNFYLDTESYEMGVPTKLLMQFEEGDLIKWSWDNKVMTGTLQNMSSDGDLFLIKNVTII